MYFDPLEFFTCVRTLGETTTEWGIVKMDISCCPILASNAKVNLIAFSKFGNMEI